MQPSRFGSKILTGDRGTGKKEFTQHVSAAIRIAGTSEAFIIGAPDPIYFLLASSKRCRVDCSMPININTDVRVMGSTSMTVDIEPG
eukprot:1376627-Rhodomonas_salina.1